MKKEQRPDHDKVVPPPVDIRLREFQEWIDRIYGQKDRERGLSGSYMWFAEELGELTRALRRQDDPDNLKEEFADVLAWLSTLASIVGIDLQDAVQHKYGSGCPYCKTVPCAC